MIAISPQQVRLVFRTYRIFWALMVVGVLVNLLYYGVVILEKRTRINGLKAQYMRERKQVGRVDKKNGEVQQFLAAREDLQAFRSRLPEEWDVDTVAEAVDQLILRNDLNGNIVELTPKGIVDFFLLKYTADVQARGVFSNLKQMLADVQNLPYLLCIEGLSFQNMVGKEGRVEISLKLSTFFRGNPTEGSGG